MSTDTTPDGTGGEPVREPTDPVRPGGWLLLIDPARSPEPGLLPEPGAVAGAWEAYPDGSTGRFHANPDHVPSPGSPTDPLDAVLHLLGRGEAAAADLTAALREVDLGVALDGDGVALVAPAPDGVPSVLVTTAPAHRRRMEVPGWRELTVGELAAALPVEGVDVLLNPGAAASMRVSADTVRAAGEGSGQASKSPAASAAASSIRER